VAPERIICLRHAEEPDEKRFPDDGPGLDERGRESKRSLTARGWRRARALAATMLCGTLPDDAVARTRLFVPDYDDGFDRHRSYETLLPLAERLGLEIEHPCEKDQPGKLAKLLRSASGVAVVCWQHENLELLVSQLTGDDNVAWPQGRFDLIWLLLARGETYDLTPVEQPARSG